jgi:hypothetical protein
MPKLVLRHAPAVSSFIVHITAHVSVRAEHTDFNAVTESVAAVTYTKSTFLPGMPPMIRRVWQSDVIRDLERIPIRIAEIHRP